MNGLFIQKYVFVQQNIIFQCFVTKDNQYHLCYKQTKNIVLQKGAGH